MIISVSCGFMFIIRFFYIRSCGFAYTTTFAKDKGIIVIDKTFGNSTINLILKTFGEIEVHLVFKKIGQIYMYLFDGIWLSDMTSSILNSASYISIGFFIKSLTILQASAN